MVDIVVVGSINVDMLARVGRHPLPGETVLGDDLVMLPGGKGANQAVAAARLADRPGVVAMVGAVGNDQFAEPALSGLVGADVDLQHLIRVDRPTGIALITVDEAGENSIVVVPGANQAVTPRLVRQAGALVRDARVLVLQCEIPTAALAEAARTTGGRVILNFAPVAPLDADTVLRADPLIVNQHEARGALQALGVAPSDDDDDETLARALVAAGVASVIVTQGAAGALVAEAGTRGLMRVESVPAPRVTAVDTTGAGDAFVGAIAFRLAQGDGLVEAAQYANRVGAFAVTKRGTQPAYPCPADLLPEA
ncbi:MAG: ribokinase [Promicromonosporaceae bacterium]|nr:ribokinase [Promicromonosporaceae bacterium]